MHWPKVESLLVPARVVVESLSQELAVPLACRAANPVAARSAGHGDLHFRADPVRLDWVQSDLESSVPVTVGLIALRLEVLLEPHPVQWVVPVQGRTAPGLADQVRMNAASHHARRAAPVVCFHVAAEETVQHAPVFAAPAGELPLALGLEVLAQLSVLEAEQPWAARVEAEGPLSEALAAEVVQPWAVQVEVAERFSGLAVAGQLWAARQQVARPSDVACVTSLVQAFPAARQRMTLYRLTLYPHEWGTATYAKPKSQSL